MAQTLSFINQSHLKTDPFDMGNGKFVIAERSVTCNGKVINFPKFKFDGPDNDNIMEDRAINLVFSLDPTSQNGNVGMTKRGKYSTKITKPKSSKPFVK